MNVRFKARLPWALTFSVCPRHSAAGLGDRRGADANVPAAQQALLHRAQCDAAARRGEYDATFERGDQESLPRARVVRHGDGKNLMTAASRAKGSSSAIQHTEKETPVMQTAVDKPRPSGPKPEAKPDPKDDLKSLPLPEVEKRLASSPAGLTGAEAQKRLAQYGPNEIAEKKTNALLKFLSYFWGPIPWMIEVAVILSAAVRHWPDFGIILLL